MRPLRSVCKSSPGGGGGGPLGRGGLYPTSWKAFCTDSGRSFHRPARTAPTLPPEGPGCPLGPFPSPLPFPRPPPALLTTRGLSSDRPSLLACCLLSCFSQLRPQHEQWVSSPLSTWRCQAQLYPQAQETHLRVRVMARSWWGKPQPGTVDSRRENPSKAVTALTSSATHL